MAQPTNPRDPGEPFDIGKRIAFGGVALMFVGMALYAIDASRLVREIDARNRLSDRR